jgi:hypothetical protein
MLSRKRMPPRSFVNSSASPDSRAGELVSTATSTLSAPRTASESITKVCSTLASVTSYTSSTAPRSITIRSPFARHGAGFLERDLHARDGARGERKRTG